MKHLLFLPFQPNVFPRWTWNPGADPILVVPNEEMEIDLKGGNFEWKTFPSPCFPTWVLLKIIRQNQILQWESRISSGKFYFRCQKPLVSRMTFCVCFSEFSDFFLSFVALFFNQFTSIFLL